MDNLAFESVAGRGGSGVVWLATHRDGTKLAVKLLHAPNDRQFRKEARTVAGLVHPGIVVVYDYGVLPADVPPTLDGVRPGAAWLAMERLGPSLAELAPTLTDRERVEVVAEVLDALAHAHARGVLHLDVKPQNLLRAPDGRYRLVDFGIASVDGTAEAGFGTPGYAPPERHRRGELGPWSDVFSVGAMARDLLRDRPDLGGWIARATERDPLRRWPSAARAAQELRGARSSGIPEHWPPALRVHEVPRSVGTGLVALRTAPFAGRVAERDQLWQTWRAVAASGRGAVVRITGPPGSGRWRLACEVVWRVAELDLGAAVALTELTLPALARALGPVPADEPRLDAALSASLPDLRVRRAWLRALTDDREPPDDTVAALAAARLRGVGRAVVAVRDPSAALDAFADRVRGHPTLLLRVGDPGDPEVDGEIRVALPPLSPAERRWLLQRLLPLDADLAARLADRHDFPGRLRDALLDQVDAGLRESPDGFGADPVDVEPDARVLRWVARTDPLARRALAVGALLGPELRDEAWTAACAAVGVPTSWAAADDAVRAGLARGGAGRITLEPGLARALVAGEPDADDLRVRLAAAAQAGGDRERAAVLLETAGHPDAAAALVAAAEELNEHGHHVRSRALRARAAAAYERAGDPRRAAFQRSWVAWYDAPDPAPGRALVELGRQRSWPEVEASGHELVAIHAWAIGDLAVHEASLRAAWTAYARHPEAHGGEAEVRANLLSGYEPATLLADPQPWNPRLLVMYGRAAAVLQRLDLRDLMVAAARVEDTAMGWSLLARVVACLDARDVARELCLRVLDGCVEDGEPVAQWTLAVLARLDVLDGDIGAAAARLAVLAPGGRLLTEDLVAAHRGDLASLVGALRAYCAASRIRSNFGMRWQHPVLLEAARLLPAGPDRDRVRAMADLVDDQLRTNGVIGALPPL